MWYVMFINFVLSPSSQSQPGRVFFFRGTHMGNSKIKWNFKKNKKLKVELNTVCQWLVVCLKFM